jgi:hypothetical protein
LVNVLVDSQENLKERGHLVNVLVDIAGMILNKTGLMETECNNINWIHLAPGYGPG